MRGSLIVFEGLDRSGKDTQVNMLVKYLGDECEKISFPNEDTEMGRLCRRCLNGDIVISDISLHLLCISNMAETIPRIEDLLQKGKTVICSRYMYSSIAYSTARGLDYDWCVSTCSLFLLPDLLVYMRVDPMEASYRKGYGEGRYENISLQEKVSQVYERLLSNSIERILCIDSSYPIEDIHNDILSKYVCWIRNADL